MDVFRILVTGGHGTVGTQLVEQLRQRGHDVISSDLQHAPDEMGFSLRADRRASSYVRCDIGEFRQLERVFDSLGPFDFVYNCAAEFGRWNGEDFYEAVWRTNAVGTKHLLRLQSKHRFKLIHFSSSEVYGDWDDVMSENVPQNNGIHQLNDYAMSKWVNEMQVRNAARQDSTESVIVRLFNTYGPGEFYSPYRSVNCRFVYCALHNIPWTVFRGHSRTSTFLPDTVRTLSNIITNFHSGEVYNIAGSEFHSVEELSETILRVTGADRSLVRYRDHEPLTTRDKRVDAAKARWELGHTDTCTLEQGIEMTAEWMRKIYAESIDSPYLAVGGGK